MWIDVIVLLETPAADVEGREVLNRAMQRRGWDLLEAGAYKASFVEAADEMSVVKTAETDVKQSIYVAGIERFNAVCFISAPLGSETPDFESASEDEDCWWRGQQ